MDLSPHNFVSVNEILADVLKVVDDSSFKLNSKGWYTSQIQQALEELSFETFFNQVNKSFPVPENLRLEMPKGAFNMENIYLFNGDDCNINDSVNVYTKRNFINSKSGNGYVARDKFFNNRDRFHKQRGIRDTELIRRAREEGKDPSLTGPNNIYYCGIQNGLIMLSDNCRNFERVMLVYTGIMTDIGETPVVPQFFRQAVKDYTLIEALQTKMTDTVGTNAYGHWAGLKKTYEVKKDKPFTGSWFTAEKRAKNLNSKERQDYKEYFTRLNY